MKGLLPGILRIKEGVRKMNFGASLAGKKMKEVPR